MADIGRITKCIIEILKDEYVLYNAQAEQILEESLKNPKFVKLLHKTAKRKIHGRRKIGWDC